MKKTVIITLLVLIVAIYTAFSTKNPSSPRRVADRVITQTTRQVITEFQLHFCGRGYEMPEGTVKNLKLTFTVKEPLSKCAARQLVISCLNLFLENMRSDPEGELAFDNWPPDYNATSIALFVYAKDGTDLRYPYPSIVSGGKGRIRYMYCDPDDPAPEFCRITEIETLEEALATIQQETDSEPSTQVAADDEE